MPAFRDSSGDQQRAELVRAAARVLARNGVSDATTRRIAAEAGIPLGKIHYWFATKDDLLAEVVVDHLGRLTDAVEGAAAQVPAQVSDQVSDPVSDPVDGAPAPPSAEELLALFRAAFSVDEDTDRGAGIAPYELLTWALRTPGHEALARRQVQAFREAATRISAPWYAAHGESLGASQETLATFLSALYDGLVLAWLADPEGTCPDEVFALVSRLLARP